MTHTPANENFTHQQLDQHQQEYHAAAELLKAGDEQGALNIFQRLVAANTPIWEVYNDCGAIAVSHDDLDMAHDMFSHAVSLQPEPGVARLHLAMVEHMQKHFEQALATLSPLLRKDSANNDILRLAREIVGAAPVLSPIAWARFVSDLRTFSQEQRQILDSIPIWEQRANELERENQSLRTQVAELNREIRESAFACSPSGQAVQWEKINKLPDTEWLNVLIRSVEIPSYRGFPLPGFPSEGLQVGTVGSANEMALREGFNFHQVVKEVCEQQGHPLTPDMHLLDFGTGWGRYARLFMKDIRPENVLGVDVDRSFIDTCRQTFPYGKFETVPAFPPTELPADHFGLIVAYSVFSHLSEPAATAWIKEFSRILAPGGMIAITTQGRAFLQFCEDIRTSGQITHPWHRNLARSFTDLNACQNAYDRGEFLFSPTGGGDVRPSTFYGEALIPQGFVETHWSAYLEPVLFMDSGRLPQALIVMRKPK